MGSEAVHAQGEGLLKPRLRGVSHQYAFFVSLACGVGLILAASGGRARAAAAIYAGAVSRSLGPARSITVSRGVPPRGVGCDGWITP